MDEREKLKGIWGHIRKAIEPKKEVWQANPTKTWTTAIMKGLTNCKKLFESQKHLHVWHKTHGGEYMLDFTLSAWPGEFGNFPAVQGWVNDNKRFGIVVAAESEMGSYYSSSRNFRLVMDDFCKLVDVQAQYKVMVYGCHDGDDLEKAFAQVLDNRLFPNPEADNWLFVGLPHKYEKHGKSSTLEKELHDGTLRLHMKTTGNDQGFVPYKDW